MRNNIMLGIQIKKKQTIFKQTKFKLNKIIRNNLHILYSRKVEICQKDIKDLDTGI